MTRPNLNLGLMHRVRFLMPRSMCRLPLMGLPLMELPPELLERVWAVLCLQAYGRLAQTSRACKAVAERTLGLVVTAEVVRRLKTGGIRHWNDTNGWHNSLDVLCSRCPELVLPAGILSITKTFDFCRSLTSITLPPDLESVGVEAFCGCTALRTVVLPPTLKVIGAWAFFRCSFTSITLPAGLQSIDEYAFAYK